jgi:hypothetical protein
LECSSFKRDHYFTAVTWLVHHQVAAIWMNRVQNISVISLCQGPVWNCDTVSTVAFYSTCFQNFLLVTVICFVTVIIIYIYFSLGELSTTKFLKP